MRHGATKHTGGGRSRGKEKSNAAGTAPEEGVPREGTEAASAPAWRSGRAGEDAARGECGGDGREPE